MLIHHKQVFILIHNIQLAWFEALFIPGFLNGNLHARLQRIVVLCHLSAIHTHTVSQQFLHLRPAGVRHLLHQKTEQLTRGFNFIFFLFHVKHFFRLSTSVYLLFNRVSSPTPLLLFRRLKTQYKSINSYLFPMLSINFSISLLLITSEAVLSFG